MIATTATNAAIAQVAPSTPDAPTTPLPTATAPTIPQERIRAARADAESNLVRAILRLPLDRAFDIGEWLAVRGIPAANLTELSNAARVVGQPRIYRDGACEVTLQLDRPRIINAVNLWTSRRDPKAATVSLMPVTDHTPLIVTGVAAAPNAVATPEQTAVTAEARDWTLRAAKLDARLAVVERIRTLRLGPTLTVGDMMLEQPLIAWDLGRTLPDIDYGPPRFTADGRCTIDARMPLPKLSRHLATLANLYYRGTRIDVSLIDQLSDFNQNVELTAHGVGTSPPSITTHRTASAPDWSDTTLTAIGTAEFEGPADSANPSFTAAQENALFDARRRLGTVIDELRTPDGRRVAEILDRNPQLAPDIAVFFTGAVQIDERIAFPGGRIDVQLALPPRRLWQLIAPLCQ